MKALMDIDTRRLQDFNGTCAEGPAVPYGPFRSFRDLGDRRLLSHLRVARGPLFGPGTRPGSGARLYSALGPASAPIASRIASVARMLNKMVPKIEDRHEARHMASEYRPARRSPAPTHQ